MPDAINRRALLRGAVALPLASALPQSMESGRALPPRLQHAHDIRNAASELQARRTLAPHNANSDEDKLPFRIGCYAKGFPQNQYGEVVPKAYEALLSAVRSERFEDFENLPRNGGRKQSNPQTISTFHLEGGDPLTFAIPPAPSIASEGSLSDVSELYRMALCRDVPFADYGSSNAVKDAAADLKATSDRLFRNTAGVSFPGAASGPYISQFLFKRIPYSSGFIQQRYNNPLTGNDFMTAENEWAQMQAGFLPWREVRYDETPRYLRTGRDLAEYVHYDFTYQAHLSAALILLNMNARSILNCNQFKSGNNPYRYSTVEEGFITFGPAEATDWIGRVSTAALKAAYYQKWAIHRRVRPEALGGLIHLNRTGKRQYPIHHSLADCRSVNAVHAKHGSYLLPQAYPEGCPMHPAYPSGHAAIAGACAVILKVCFDGDMLLPDCVEPSADGTDLVPCRNYFPTVTGEINKLALNIAKGREWAGIHYPSDSIAGLLLGEEVAISILQDLVRTYTEPFRGLALQKFDGSNINIRPDGVIVAR